MKQCQKWWNEEQNQEYIEEFLAKHIFTTQEQVLDALVEAVWRACCEWIKKEAISLDERGDISREIINRELKS